MQTADKQGYKMTTNDSVLPDFASSRMGNDLETEHPPKTALNGISPNRQPKTLNVNHYCVSIVCRVFLFAAVFRVDLQKYMKFSNYTQLFIRIKKKGGGKTPPPNTLL